MTKLYLSVDDAVALAPISRTRVYKAIQSGDLVSVKLGRRRLIAPAALDAYLSRATCTRKGGA